MLNQIETDTIFMSPAAAQAVRDLCAQRNLGEEYALRVYVAGRTCSGLQYGMSLDDKPGETDTTFELEGIKILVDNVSIQYMRGSTINFVNDERGKGFIVENPNVLPACDCSGGNCNS
jgi:iron-sulfur cluster assembly accessory protein